MKNNNFLIVLLLLVIFGGVYAIYNFTDLFGNLGTGLSKNSYQAVFLSNNQVYFGKVKGINHQYLKLTEIYYLILKQPLQQQTADNTQAKPEYTLVKLGNELHGPKDEMLINRDQILFVEELKPDSKVASTINDFKNNPNQSQPTATPKPAK